MPSSIIVRKATKQDLAAILKLYEQPEIDNGVSLSIDQAVEIFVRMARYPNYALYVADSQKQIVGSFALLIMDNLGHLGAPSAVVEDVVVSPEHQNKGIGKKMILTAISIAADASCYKICLSANSKRKIAHHFYESLGFEKHGYSYKILLSQKKV